MGKLFGTDGIRGRANEYPMIPEMAVKIGKAVAVKFKDKKKSSIVIGRDTRLSGNMIECALVSGCCSAGADVYSAGVIPTPGLAMLASKLNVGAGIVVSASHNPFYDNGIKLFDGKGYKLPDETELEIEELINNDNLLSGNISSSNIGCLRTIDDASVQYTGFLKNTLPAGFSIKGVKIAIDCSNGATYKIAPSLFADLGAEIETINTSPDGYNINENCGSEHIGFLSKKVLQTGSDIGIAFDGDGDRLVAVDEKGRILTGDKVIAICAIYLKKYNKLKSNHVVTTVMSNMGLVSLFKDNGIKHTMSRVGDRYVMQEMLRTGSVIGGEDSGHVIFSEYHTTGDGILTALKLIQFMKEESKSLSDLSDIMTVYPQILMNVNVSHKPHIYSIKEVSDAVRQVETILGEKGRVLIRYSGTQPICRIMVEGESQSEIEKYCGYLADKIKEHIG
jgi:phosphoglucosamine mutase